MKFDFTIRDAKGQLLAVVEAKARPGVDAGWARAFRRNLLETLGDPGANYFVVITPDRLFLWSQPDLANPDMNPSHEFELAESFEDLIGDSPGARQGRAFTTLVATWLSRLVNGESLPQAIASTEFAQTLRSGNLVAEAAA